MKKRKNLLFILSLSFAMLMGIGLNFVPMSSQAEFGRIECWSWGNPDLAGEYVGCSNCMFRDGEPLGGKGKCRGEAIIE